MGWQGTLLLLTAGIASAGFALWQQYRTRPLGEVSILPSTALLAIGVVMTVTALAHIITLSTGLGPDRLFAR